MNLYFRLLWVLLTSRFKPAANVPDITQLNFRVLPNDLDVNLHMNNGRYATIMDLGRINLMQRMGFFRHVVKNKWIPVIAHVELQFLRPLKLFQKYTLCSRVAAWDDKWIYIEQIFQSRNKDIARGVVRAQVRRKRGPVPVNEIMQLISFAGESPEILDNFREVKAND